MCELNLIAFATMVSALKPVYVGRFCHNEEEEAAEGDAEATTRAVDPAVSATSSDDDDGPDRLRLLPEGRSSR